MCSVIQMGCVRRIMQCVQCHIDGMCEKDHAVCAVSYRWDV